MRKSNFFHKEAKIILLEIDSEKEYNKLYYYQECPAEIEVCPGRLCDD